MACGWTTRKCSFASLGSRRLSGLRHHPHQIAIAEEALALRIEASLRSGDGRGPRLAAAYLQRYPHGRYRELAKRALAAPAP